MLVAGTEALFLPFAGGTLVPSPTLAVPLVTDAAGAAFFTTAFPPGLSSGTTLWFQAGALDPAAVQGIAASNALATSAP